MPKAAASRPFILVLAGVNGAGKSSVGGAILADHGLTWFNRDTYARELMTHLGLVLEDANGRAWAQGRDRLEGAMADGTNFALETTLGARTIPDLLVQATRTHDVFMIFCGLATPEQHILRVQRRVAHGGHDIPEHKIRERWVASRANLIRLMPLLARLQVFDNSAQAAPGKDIPDPQLVLEMVHGEVLFPGQDDVLVLESTPDWARPIVQAAIESVCARPPVAPKTAGTR